MDLQDKLQAGERTDASHDRYLTFVTDGQLFALPIAQIVQITQMQPVTPLPEQPHEYKGIINLRGQMIPVMDIRLRFGKQEAPLTERTCIIIVRIQGDDFGLIVDEVDEVADIEAEQISAPPKIEELPSRVADYLTGIATLKAAEGHEERVIMLLHAGKLFGKSAALPPAAESDESVPQDAP